MRIALLGWSGVIALLAAMALAWPARAAEVFTVYVGPYTNTSSKGIYQFTFDAATGTAGPPVLAAETVAPSFLALHPNGKFLYAVNEVQTYQGRASGIVSAFAIDAGTHALTLLNQQPSEGADPCHLVIDKAGTHVVVSNYSGSSVAVLPIGADGRLGPASSVVPHTGRGPNAARQSQAHAHGIYLDAANRFAYAPDLGADRVVIYAYDATAGRVAPHGAGVLAPGDGPRHLALDRDERHAFVLNELSNTITVFDLDRHAGAMTATQTVTTLPAGFTGENTTAEIELSRDGRFLYASNRGHDSIAVFAVHADSGRLSPRGHVPAGGKVPRHFAIDPTGRWMLVAHQESGSISVFARNPETGALAATGARIDVARPVSLLFVARSR